MARMHSRKRGKASSTKPVKKTKPSWVSYKPKEIETLVLKFAKAGKTAAEIGIILRDSYGVPSVKALTNKKITAILKANKLAPKLPDDLSNLIKRYIALEKHMESNKHDIPGKRGMQLTESKIKRLIKYYKAQGVLPQDWRFDKKRAKLLVE